MTPSTSNSKCQYTFKPKAWWIIGVSIACLVFGIQNHYSDIDLQNQYKHLYSKMTTIEQLQGSMGLSMLQTGTYVLFTASIITGIMSVVGFYWFDDRRFFR